MWLHTGAVEQRGVGTLTSPWHSKRAVVSTQEAKRDRDLYLNASNVKPRKATCNE